jgi:hypothetical protein
MNGASQRRSIDKIASATKTNKMKKELPILMSTPMVIATIEDRKTMTRRMKGLEDINLNPDNWVHDGWGWKDAEGNSSFLFGTKNGESEQIIKLPWNVGDILWVRESFAPGYEGVLDDKEMKYWTFKVDGDQIYSNGDYAKIPCKPNTESATKWKPSIHMPKIASRIWLEVTDVRVERIQDITEEDAIAEGVMMIKSELCFGYKDYVGTGSKIAGMNVIASVVDTARESFESLWEVINGQESWQLNVWVWCVSFKVLSTTGRPELLNEPEVKNN